jgi:hypothetical protein
MAERSKFGWTHEKRLLAAHTSCLCLGLTLLLWGLAPAFVQRLATGQAPGLGMFISSGFVFVLGGVFISFHVLIRRGVRWSAWSAYFLSVALCGAGIALAFSRAPAMSGTAVLVLSGCSTLFTWLALSAWPRTGSARSAATVEPPGGEQPGVQAE